MKEQKYYLGNTKPDDYGSCNHYVATKKSDFKKLNEEYGEIEYIREITKEEYEVLNKYVAEDVKEYMED